MWLLLFTAFSKYIPASFCKHCSVFIPVVVVHSVSPDPNPLVNAARTWDYDSESELRRN